MQKILIILVAIISLAFISPCYADDFLWAVTQQMKQSGRPEITVETKDYVSMVFGLESSMKEFRYDKKSDTYQVWEYRKLEDSTKSLFHKEPHERLQETIEMYK